MSVAGLSAMLAQLQADMDDVRAAIVEQGVPAGENAPTSAMGDLIRSINPTSPVNTSAPILSGPPVAGGTLTTSTGVWAGVEPITYEYQWFRAGVAVVGATTASYVTSAADIGITVFCRVTATNAGGNAIQNSNTVTLTDPGTTSTVRADTTTVTADSTTITADHQAV